LALAGGVLQTVLALALWPVHRYLPESRALALLYGELAGIAEGGGPVTESPAATEPIVAARTALSTLESARSVEAERYLAWPCSARPSGSVWRCSRSAASRRACRGSPPRTRRRRS
jgi:hypothetical protein